MLNYRSAAASLTLAAALVGVADAGPALADATSVASTSAYDAAPTALVPADFINLSARALPATGHAHTFTVTYRNDSPTDQVVAPQILVESPDTGRWLAPADIKVEQRTADGTWQQVPLASETGTLYTDLVSAQRTLRPGETLTQRYRITVIAPGAAGTVQPRLALYG
jgi:hypothetical protein